MATKKELTERLDVQRNQMIDVQSAIIAWRKGLGFNSEDDLISELDRMITEALKERKK